MTLKEEIIDCLRKQDGLTDREITNIVLGPEAPQQAVNQQCRDLESRGVLKRTVRQNGLIGNFLAEHLSGSARPLRASRQSKTGSTINLSHYQQLFDIENTAERCKQVNTTMEQLWKSELDQLTMELQLGQNYRVATYGTTLTTVYHDALNPKYADQKKDSNTGRRYFAQIACKIGEKESNLLTLEFNGVDRKMYVFMEMSFYQIYALHKADRLQPMLEEADVRVFMKKDSFSKEELNPAELGHTLQTMIQPRQRPAFYLGYVQPLEGAYETSEILARLSRVWGQTSDLREYVITERMQNAKAVHIMSLIASEQATYSVTLFNHTYEIHYGSLGKEITGTRQQEFTLKHDGQTIVHGQFNFSEYNVRFALNKPMMDVLVEKQYHLCANVSDLLESHRKEWWISKSFKMKDQDNEAVKRQALRSLEQHGIPVRNDQEYLLGTYNNDEQRFEENLADMKGNIVCAALLFAHASGRGGFKLPEDPGWSGVSTAEATTIDDMQQVTDYNSNFDFAIIYETIQASELTFSKDIIRDLHLNLTALDDKHFVILSGISGTGKTQLAKLYANAVYGLSYDEENPYLSIIPVRPDWTDGTSLLGYYSSFENRYMMTEFLSVLQQAHEEREKPYFVVLDEMNLARVEYYLSDYLSGVESGKEIPLHNRHDLEGIPSKISIPPNLYLIGTINVDETTHSISDKVLDRAFVMTLSDVDLETFWERLDLQIQGSLETEFAFLKEIHQILAPHHLHFGYRTMKEMMYKLHRHQALAPEDQASSTMVALDQVITEKVLPKLKGDERIAELLEELKEKFSQQFGQDSVSRGHIIRMEKELLRYGATQFWH